MELSDVIEMRKASVLWICVLLGSALGQPLEHCLPPSAEPSQDPCLEPISPCEETYMPTPESLIPCTGPSESSVESYYPGPNPYYPSPDHYYPSLDPFYPTPDPYYPSPDSYYPSPDHYYPGLDPSYPSVGSFYHGTEHSNSASSNPGQDHSSLTKGLRVSCSEKYNPSEQNGHNSRLDLYKVKLCDPNGPSVRFQHGSAPAGQVVVKPGTVRFPKPSPIHIQPGQIRLTQPEPMRVRIPPIQPPTPPPILIRPPPVQPPTPPPILVKPPPVQSPPIQPFIVRPPPVPVPKLSPINVQPDPIYPPRPSPLIVRPPKIVMSGGPTVCFKFNYPLFTKTDGTANICACPSCNSSAPTPFEPSDPCIDYSAPRVPPLLTQYTSLPTPSECSA